MSDRPAAGAGVQPRVLHVIASLAIGGTERQLVEFVRRSSAPDRHFFALFDEPGALADRVPNPPILLGPLSRRVVDVRRNAGVVLGLRRAIGSLGVDLVHAHLDVSELVAAAAAPHTTPLVASRRGHNTRVLGNPGWRLAEGLAHRRVRLMICNSGYLAERTRRRDLWPPAVEVIHNAVDLEAFRPASMPDGPPTVVVVANMHAYKRHDRFLRGFRSTLERVPDARAILVGGGGGLGTVRELVRALSLDDAVELAGPVDDPRPFVRRAHVAALTSDHEGFPNVLLEAMAMARPVVATAVGGVPELVRDGVEGILAPPDAGAVGDALARLLEGRSEWAPMGERARRRAEAFSWDELVRSTEAVYRRVLGRR